MGRKKRRRQEVEVVRVTAEGVSRGEERIQSEKEGGRGGRKHCKRRESNSSLNTYNKLITVLGERFFLIQKWRRCKPIIIKSCGKIITTCSLSLIINLIPYIYTLVGANTANWFMYHRHHVMIYFTFLVFFSRVDGHGGVLWYWNAEQCRALIFRFWYC